MHPLTLGLLQGVLRRPSGWFDVGQKRHLGVGSSSQHAKQSNGPKKSTHLFDPTPTRPAHDGRLGGPFQSAKAPFGASAKSHSSRANPALHQRWV